MSQKYNLDPNSKLCSQSTFRRTSQSLWAKSFAQAVSYQEKQGNNFQNSQGSPWSKRGDELEMGFQGLRNAFFLTSFTVPLLFHWLLYLIICV